MSAFSVKRWLASLAVLSILFGMGTASAQTSDDAFLGVELENDQEGTRGAEIFGVQKGSPAGKAGLEKGFRVIRCDEKKVPNGSAFIKILQASSPGDRLVLLVENKGGWQKELVVVLGAQKVVKPKVVRAFLGVEIDEAEHGIRIEKVSPGSPAAKAGLKKGDLLTAANGKRLDGEVAFAEVMKGLRPGSSLKLDVLRDGWKKKLDISLGSREEDSSVPAGKRVERPPVEEKKEAKKPGWMGLRLEPAAEGGHLKILSVISDSPAEAAGIQAGDILIKMGGKEVGGFDSLGEVLREYFAGDSVTMVVLRNGEKTKLEITLGIEP